MATKSSQGSQTRREIYLSNPWHVIQTGFMLLTWTILVCFRTVFIYSYIVLKAIYNELIGPTMSTLAANVNVHYSGMGSVLAARGIGFLFANIVGVFLRNSVRNHPNGVVMCAYILPAAS